ncbi:hypothetical protein WJX82_001452 [Trebouxia sp. C0006]
MDPLTPEQFRNYLLRAKEHFPVIAIQTNSLFRKIVQYGRGGYCFEQNLLFAAALKACGFSIYLLQIRTLKGPAIPVPDALRVHMAVGVVLDGVHWHCDVGYGGKGLRLPIRNDLIQTSKDGKFASVNNKEDKAYTESTLCSELYKDVQDALDSKGCFQDLYFFHLQETKFPEFLLLNWYTSTCPLASHLNNVVVAMQTPEGRHTYDGKEFKVFQGTTLSWSKHPKSEDEVYLYLKQLFNLKFDAA